ncbi:MAG: hypothetical protein WC852_00405 [Candidatus Nanoarchaeia archaeon]|jgi:hypothetical protein
MGLEQALGKYEYFLDDKNVFDVDNSGMGACHNTIDFVLNPDEINEFLQKTRDFNFGQCCYNEITGKYVSKLIQNSFNAGNHFFVLETGRMNINCLGQNLRGSVQNGNGFCYPMIIVEVIGSIGDNCFTGSCGCYATIHGNVGNNLARCSNHSRLDVRGDAGYGAAEYSVSGLYEFRGSVKSGFYMAKDCTFRAHNEDALKVLKKSVPAGRSNILQKADGENFLRVKRIRDRVLEKFMRRR